MVASQLEACFVDTNVWLYAFIEGNEPEKSGAAHALLETCQSVISVQIVNEVCINLIKKAGFPEERIRQLIEAFYEKYQVVELDQTVLLSASQLRQRYALSFWDSLVIASALAAQVKIVYSEDIQHGLVIEKKLQIINPFFPSS